MRQRLDALIDKVVAAEAPQPDDPMERLVQLLEREGVVGTGTANSLVQAHRRVVQNLKGRLEK